MASGGIYFLATGGMVVQDITMYATTGVAFGNSYSSAANHWR